jgi:hypothetical protein
MSAYDSYLDSVGSSGAVGAHAKVTPMPSPRLSRGWSIGLLIGVFFIVGTVLALMGSAVLIPQGAAVGVLLLAAVVFLVSQLAVFRLFGLRSRADEDPEQTDPPGDDDSDWRAWRG